MVRSALILIVPVLVCAQLACDSVQPDEVDRLVVESFFETNAAAPAVEVRRTVPLAVGTEGVRNAFVPGATVTVSINAEAVAYRESHDTPGLHLSEDARYMKAGDLFTVDVTWRGQHGRGVGTVPFRITIDSMMIEVPVAPVEAVLLDSLKLDSLGVDAKTGYLYPIETTVWWNADMQPREDDWIQAQVKPFSRFSSAVVDFFLLPEQVFRETDAAVNSGKRSWIGLYAIAVNDADDPLPEHSVRLSVVRSGRDYADYVFTRTAPDRREPVSNVTGALGIVAGISVDSLVVQLNQSHAGKRTVVSGE